MKRWALPRWPKLFSQAKPVAPTASSEDSLAETGLPQEVTPIGPLDASASDDELLRKFVVERDDRAFAVLVGRHSGMVMGVCKRVLGLEHDAEDAFQAVFLVLARKADSLRSGSSLPAWLHKTAFRVALRARTARSRRREEPAEDLSMIADQSLIASQAWDDIVLANERSIVDEELNALAERYRLPLFLCCVEGKSLEVAARQLGWSVGSVKGRLERGRQQLRRRLLLRRVLPATGVLLLTALAPTAKASTVVAPSVIAASVQAGMQYAVGRSALGYVSQHALDLAQGSWKFMSLTTLKIVVCSAALTGIGFVGASRMHTSAVAGGGKSGITLDASFAPPASRTAEKEFDLQLALAEEGRAKAGVRDGDAPKTGARDGDASRTGPRDGDAPRTGPRDGDKPRTGARDGDAPRTGPREGDAPKSGVREGERTATRSPLANFQPQTEREAALYQMILQMQREMADLRQMIEQREGGAAREGAARPKAEGERPAPRREGEK